jgi:uncharacterized transporter YbjL
MFVERTFGEQQQSLCQWLSCARTRKRSIEMYDFRMIAVATTLGLGFGAMLGAVTPTPAMADGVVAFEDAKVESGTIKSVQTANKSFVLTVRERDVTIRVSDKTEYTLDGEKSSMEQALQVGNIARVTHEGFMASKVAATSPAPSPDPES